MRLLALERRVEEWWTGVFGSGFQQLRRSVADDGFLVLFQLTLNRPVELTMLQRFANQFDSCLQAVPTVGPGSVKDTIVLRVEMHYREPTRDSTNGSSGAAVINHHESMNGGDGGAAASSSLRPATKRRMTGTGPRLVSPPPPHTLSAAQQVRFRVPNGQHQRFEQAAADDDDTT